ncbi:SOCS box domain-containing protein [Trichonephila inaurata madagascariensis]|uniref:SOCS box domain-containing protein n=1 Tax=Trichonephila inaurata madagascariensis TaxID=2747483 RepID=A0A8X7CTY5_9ARAC|nr:SOCS box domain-containing protein [Trichonephila inaurata madagascariensis]
MEQSEKTSFIRTCIEEIVVEFLENHNYILKTKKYPLYPSDLSYEYVTLVSDHYPVASSIFRWFRSAMGHCNTQNGGQIINEMVEIYREYKNELSIPLREYVLTDGILEVCYRVQIDDSQLIKEVLNLLYESWSSFGSLHFSAILKPNHHHEVQGSNQYPDYLSFFLEHARRLKLEYDGIRFIDASVYSSIRKSPVFIAADIWCWKPLLRYLQYGARFENVMVDASSTRHGVESALSDTLRSLIRYLWIRLVQPAIILSLTEPEEIQEYCSGMHLELRDLFHTLRIILRVVRRLRSDVLEFVIRDHSDQWVVEIPSERVLSHPTVQLMLPTLKERYGRPIQLQHSCRWVIRNRLNENWQLPAGINALPVPNKIKKYLNILSG